MRFSGASRAALAVGLIAGPLAGAAFGQEAGVERDTVFVPGRLDSGITEGDGETVRVSMIDAAETLKFDLATVDETINHIASANSSNKACVFFRRKAAILRSHRG